MSNQPYSLPGQQAPFSQEAEEAVIGAVLVNSENFLTVSSFLQPEDFYIIRNQYMWEAMQRISERNEPIDYLTLQDELRAANRLNDVGGPAYITHLINSVPTSVHAEIYGRLVERAAIRRRLLIAGDEIKALALDEETAIEKVTTDAEARLFKVTERNIRRDVVTLREALGDYFERVEHLMEYPNETSGLPTGFRDIDTLLGGMQKSDLMIFAGRPGMGKCIAAGTMIPTERGYLPIEQLKPQGVTGIDDDEGGVFYPLNVAVLTPEGAKQATHFYDSGSRPTRRLTTRAGYSLTATYSHPVLTLSPQGEKVWKQMAQLELGDFVAVQRHTSLWGNQTNLPDFEFDFTRISYIRKPTLPKQLDTQTAYNLGLLIGDGNLTRKNYVHFSSADPEILDSFNAWLETLSLKSRHRNHYDYSVGSVVLNTWLNHLGASGYAYEKEVPHIILSAPRDCVHAFLQGIFDTDGHSEIQRGYLQFVSSSSKLAHQVHLLLLQFGIVSKLTFKANKYRGAWHIRITGDSARRFYEQIGFRLGRKQVRSELLPLVSNGNLDVIPYLPKRQSSFPKTVNFTRYFRGNRSPSYSILQQISVYAPEVEHLLEPAFYWDVITHLEDSGIQHCYDLTVPDGHAFVANGIVSHNTSFLLSVTSNAAKYNGRIAIFSMEMGADQIVQRLISMETGINSQRLRLGQLNQQEWNRFVQATGRMGNLRIFIDDSPALTPLQLRTKCRRLVHEYGLDLIVVDYLQLMNAGSGYENNRVQEISYISRSLKELARELNVPVFTAAQLSRAVEQRQDKRPQLSDLRESGSIEQDADIVMFLYRDIVYNEATEFPNRADVIVAKHRNGPTGVISLHFENSLTKFTDAKTQTIDLTAL